MKTETLAHVKLECERFMQRLDILIALEKGNEQRVEISKDTGGYAYQDMGTRKHGSLRRSAHDLKEVLTLITQNRDI